MFDTTLFRLRFSVSWPCLIFSCIFTIYLDSQYHDNMQFFSVPWRGDHVWFFHVFSLYLFTFSVPWRGDYGEFFMYFHCILGSMMWLPLAIFFNVFSLFFFIISSKWMDEELWEQDKDLNRKPWIVYVQSNLHPPRPSWSWSYMVVGFTTTGAIGVLSPLKLLIRTMFMARCNRYNIMW